MKKMKSSYTLALFSKNCYICLIISRINLFRFKLLAVCHRWRTAFFLYFHANFLAQTFA